MVFSMVAILNIILNTCNNQHKVHRRIVKTNHCGLKSLCIGVRICKTFSIVLKSIIWSKGKEEIEDVLQYIEALLHIIVVNKKNCVQKKFQ